MRRGRYLSPGTRITADWPGCRIIVATVRRRLRRNHRTCHHKPTAPAASKNPRPSRIPRISARTAQFLVIMLLTG